MFKRSRRHGCLFFSMLNISIFKSGQLLFIIEYFNIYVNIIIGLVIIDYLNIIHVNIIVWFIMIAYLNSYANVINWLVS